MTLDLWLAYVAVLFIVCIAPGPAVILSSAQAAARGVRSSLAVIAGIEIANLIYFLLSAFGLGAIIAASETAFLAIKYVGGAYLLFLGDAGDQLAAKTAQGIAHWRPEWCLGQLRLEVGVFRPEGVDLVLRAVELLLEVGAEVGTARNAREPLRHR